ncbi:sensor histidine kinase [Aquabacterium humicola]|uniref:sensor histidine kinase n=1 Tax=Aquabacterium humicola TaxID=3237377 RepID=UPI002543A743|nr:ATP-binding protein [Rubrivivax pictus]
MTSSASGSPAALARPRARTLAVVLAWLIGGALACAAAWQFSVDRTSAALRARAERHAAALALDLTGALEKVETLPFVISLQAQVLQGLQHPGDARAIESLNHYLAEVQQRAQVAAAYVIDQQGLTIAASNWLDVQTFVGNNYGFRPYARAALSGDVGRFYAIGTTTSLPGYFLAHPVADPAHPPTSSGPPLGAVVLKISLDAFERSWAGNDEPVALVDRNGVLFLASQADWKYRSLARLNDAARREIAASQQYTGRSIEPLPGAAAALPRVVKPVGPLGWQLMLFVDLAPAHQAARGMAVGTALLVLAAALGAHAWSQRRTHQRSLDAARAALQDASTQLEHRIAERTAELLRANHDLAERYRELQQAEQLLRATQDELVQAGKLGMLGQMAAGMTHELNQPLTAAKAFADNAVAFLAQGDEASARENLQHISDACSRMGQLIAQLKGFARKSDGEVGPVDLAASIRNAALLLEADYRQRGAALSITALPSARVMGDSLRIEQVLVNLLKNALDAVAGTDERRVHLVLARDGGDAVITITDSGPGLAREARARLFEPFFTTKPSGQGLGLGLAISSSIVQAMGGRLAALDAPGDSGAQFELRLPLLDPPAAPPASIPALHDGVEPR